MATDRGSTSAPSTSLTESASGYSVPFGPGDVVPQPAVDMAVAGEADVQAQVRRAGPARLAAIAGDRRVDRHSSAAQRAGRHEPGELVAEDQRHVEHRVADPAVDQPVAIRPAEPDRRDLDQGFARAWLGHRLIVQPQSAIGVETERQHAAYCRVSDPSSRTGIQTRIASTDRLAQAK